MAIQSTISSFIAQADSDCKPLSESIACVSSCRITLFLYALRSFLLSGDLAALPMSST
nr:MAG TPA: hypothetical protein [Bacteriophage sp.]